MAARTVRFCRNRMTPFALPGQRIGILGGSFNPAHDGHLHISNEVMKRLDLDQVWWMVSPQNPLKPVSGMAPFETRLDEARRTARDPRIRVTDIEDRLGTRFTADTLVTLKARYPSVRFVWIMGADNLVGIHRWDRWENIFETVAIAIFDRPTYSLRALSAKAARRFAKTRLPEKRAKGLATGKTPAWVFLHGPLHPESATRIRARRAHRH